jgi:hypothetical protein
LITSSLDFIDSLIAGIVFSSYFNSSDDSSDGIRIEESFVDYDYFVSAELFADLFCCI